MSNRKACRIVWLCLSALVVSGCSFYQPKHDPAPTFLKAVAIPDPPDPTPMVEVPPVVQPGQMKPLPDSKDKNKKKPRPEPINAQARVIQANAAARVEPSKSNFVNATQIWPYNAESLYQVYTSPERITDIALQEGETLTSVSAGDTVRWIIGDTTSGEGTSARVHVLVKPSREDLKTNLVIHTNRRSYQLELTSTEKTWMASISWDYPLDRLKSLTRINERERAERPVAEGLTIEDLNFRYEISGDKPAWRPIRAFDDGNKVYIQFPPTIAQGELPPLFVLGNKGDAQLVNYRVRGPYYIVDRLFPAAELRLGSGRNEYRVRILREESNRSARR